MCDPSSEKKSLQDTANKFTMSRERVRQIRDKTLRKLKFATHVLKFLLLKLPNFFKYLFTSIDLRVYQFSFLR